MRFVPAPCKPGLWVALALAFLLQARGSFVRSGLRQLSEYPAGRALGTGDVEIKPELAEHEAKKRGLRNSVLACCGPISAAYVQRSRSAWAASSQSKRLFRKRAIRPRPGRLFRMCFFRPFDVAAYTVHPPPSLPHSFGILGFEANARLPTFGRLDHSHFHIDSAGDVDETCKSQMCHPLSKKISRLVSVERHVPEPWPCSVPPRHLVQLQLS